ncbi:MAG: VOC family protein [Deltaproteobacteria bacterium]|nr:VOC family protein [Deltaproteobacteria bacterium]
MITSFDHVHVYAAEPEVTLAFYRDSLGGETLGSIATSDGRRNHFVLLAGQVLVVSAFPPGLEASPAPGLGDGAMRTGYGVAHIGLNVDDVDAWAQRLADQGVDVHGDPRGDGPVRYVYFTAPDGVVFELTQYVLPARYRPALRALAALNRGIHVARRTIVSQLLRRVT